MKVLFVSNGFPPRGQWGTEFYTAQLAGALARPVWTLLQFSPDWRWMINRDDSPWYPTMRLFRQPGPGDWDSVVRNVSAELSLL